MRRPRAAGGHAINGVEQVMRAFGIPPTRANRLGLAYLVEPPAELGAEEEANLPERFRRGAPVFPVGTADATESDADEMDATYTKQVMIIGRIS